MTARGPGSGDGSGGSRACAAGLGSGLSLLVLAAALLPSAPALAAPLVSDDGAILAHVSRVGALSDWASAQYGMEIVRFWRPLVTTSFWVQERLTGVHPIPLRLANLCLHAAAALLVARLALRLGARPLGAALAGVLAGLFPHQGGSAVWIAGRVDSLAVPLVLLSTLLALDGKHARAAVAAFLACASKEIGFVTPGLVLCLALGRAGGSALGRASGPALGRSGGIARAVRDTLPVAGACAVAFAARRLALGTFVGGYPLRGNALPGPLDLCRLALESHLGTASFALAVGLPCAVLGGAGRARAFLASAAAAVIALLPLGHLLEGGEIELHLRTLFLFDCALCLALGAACGWTDRPPPLRRAVPAALLLALAAWRAAGALDDVSEWRAAAERAEEQISAARAVLAAAQPDARPVLATFDRAFEGAYVLAWGVADRFRPPFEPAPRPVWPWRPLFAGTAPRTLPTAAGETWGGDGVLDPFAPRPGARALAHVLSEGGPEGLWLDPESAERIALAVEPPAAEARYEALLATELGYDIAPLPAGKNAWTLAEVLRSAAGTELAWTVAQASDVGAELAYLEVRALGPAGEELGASAWIPIRWSAVALRPTVRALVAGALAAR